MIGYASTEALAFKLCVYFARNPDEELEYSDIRLKFGAHKHFSDNLFTAVKNGLLDRRRSDIKGSAYVYRAGPALLEMIGEKR